jgi:hypothetical protein
VGEPIDFNSSSIAVSEVIHGTASPGTLSKGLWSLGRGQKGRGRGHDKDTITVPIRSLKRQKEPSIALIFYKLPSLQCPVTANATGSSPVPAACITEHSKGSTRGSELSPRHGESSPSNEPPSGSKISVIIGDAASCHVTLNGLVRKFRKALRRCVGPHNTCE